jgi:hypothetical protein
MRQDAPGRKINEWRRESVWALLQKNASSDLDDQGGADDEGSVVGLALRFALNARPTGSQGFAPGKTNDQKPKTRTKN